MASPYELIQQLAAKGKVNLGAATVRTVGGGGGMTQKQLHDAQSALQRQGLTGINRMTPGALGVSGSFISTPGGQMVSGSTGQIIGSGGRVIGSATGGAGAIGGGGAGGAVGGAAGGAVGSTGSLGDRLIDAWQSSYDEAKQANIDLKGEVMGELDQTYLQREEDIKERGLIGQSQITQQGVDQGLGALIGGTGAEGQPKWASRAMMGRETNAELRRLTSDKAMLRAGFLERISNTYPQDISGLLAQFGQSGAMAQQSRLPVGGYDPGEQTQRVLGGAQQQSAGNIRGLIAPSGQRIPAQTSGGVPQQARPPSTAGMSLEQIKAQRDAQAPRAGQAAGMPGGPGAASTQAAQASGAMWPFPQASEPTSGPPTLARLLELLYRQPSYQNASPQVQESMVRDMRSRFGSRSIYGLT